MDWDGARLGNRLKPRHLRLLADIARLGSLTRVAAAAGISQPAVTKALAELEDIFGAPLFERTGRGLRPTPLGELALLRAGRMRHDLELWAREIASVHEGRSAHLQVGAVPCVGDLAEHGRQRAVPAARRDPDPASGHHRSAGADAARA